jgi:hypothetical protein
MRDALAKKMVKNYHESYEQNKKDVANEIARHKQELQYISSDKHVSENRLHEENMRKLGAKKKENE